MPSLKCRAIYIILGWIFLQASVCPLGATTDQGFSELVEVIQVEVAVNVIRGGAPVRGLGRDDFRITAGGKKREIEGFSVIDLVDTDPENQGFSDKLPLSARRHFVMLSDLAFAKPSSIVRARHAAMELVDQSMHPTDLIAVAAYSSRHGLKVHLGFTDDRDKVRLAIASLGLPAVIRSYLQASEEDLEILRANPAGASRFDAEVQSQLEAMVVEEGYAAQGDLASRLTSSLEKLAEALSPINGRKHLIYLSEGFPSSLVVGIGVGTESDRREIQKMNDAVNVGEYGGSGRRYGRVDQRNHLQEALQRFVDVDSAIHTVDTGGIVAVTSRLGRPGHQAKKRFSSWPIEREASFSATTTT